MITNKNYLKGFTLVEMAVVIVIIGILIGGLLVPITAQMDLRNYSEERKSMEDINEALLGFAMANGYLPCPAVSFSNGAEDRTGNTCTGNKRLGFLPWATLGLHKLDSWGHMYRYSVTLAYADSTTKITLTPRTAGDIFINTRANDGTLTLLTTAGNLSPAVAISMGKNGFLAFSDDGVQIANSSATNTDEVTNGSQSVNFVSRTYTDNTGAAGGEFDDLITWISPNIYVTKMVSANQLP